MPGAILAFNVKGELEMDTDNALKCCGRLSLLAALSLALIPDFSWWHPVLGFWPLWLLSVPAAVGLVQRARRPAAMPQVPQVLVFPMARRRSRPKPAALRQAA
jgi:hypothetical protein